MEFAAPGSRGKKCPSRLMTPTDSTVVAMKLLLISDIHANWPALRAVLERESDADEILCLGDLVDYGPEPVRCVQWAADHLPPERVIQGNHDWAVGWDEDPLCSAAYRDLAEVTRKYSRTVLSGALRTFLCKLWPERALILDGRNCLACHALPSDPRFSYLACHGPRARWQEEVIHANRPNILFVGHTHLPCELRLGATLVVNPGSVGQPKDGDPRAAYAVMENGKVSLRRVAYDIEETIRGYQQTPFSPEQVAALGMVLRTGGTLPRGKEALSA